MRFGDPETQPLMLRLESDLVPLLVGAAEGRLPEAERARPASATRRVCVVMTSEGYPRSVPRRAGRSRASTSRALPDAKVFHSGTRRGAAGGWETAGGRVLGVTARGRDLAAARARAYELVRGIRFEGAHFRSDIASRA